MSLTITTKTYERVTIECPMEEAKQAIDWMYENGYSIARGGWSGPARHRDGWPKCDSTRYHTEGEKEVLKPHSFVPGLPTQSLTIRVEGYDGAIRDVPIDQFCCTGIAPSLEDVKAGKINRCELGTIGYFRHPNGHLCDAGLYEKYVGGAK